VIALRAQIRNQLLRPLTCVGAHHPAHAFPSLRILINISSTAGIEAKPSPQYSGSKFAFRSFLEALYHELQAFNVRVLLWSLERLEVSSQRR